MSAALLAAFVVAAAITLSVGGSALRKNAEDDLRGVAHLVHLRIESFLDARFADLRLTAATEAMDDIITGDEHFRVQNSLLRLRRELPGIYEELWVTDMSGGTIAATRLERLDSRLPVEPTKLEPAADGTRMSAGPAEFARVPRKVLVLARPIMSRIDGTQSGWLIALVRWDAISRLVNETPIGGRAQRPAAFAVLECLGRPQAGGLLWWDAAEKARFTLAQEDLHEEPKLGGRVRSDARGGLHDIGPVYDWVVKVRRDPAEAFAIVYVFGWSVLGAAMLGLLFAAGVAVRLAGGLSQRLERLSEGTRKLAAGENASRVADMVNDELGDLAQAFDTMADAIQTARRDTEKANAELAENNRRLLEASRLKDEFLANISHELRTPLNGTLGFLGLVTDRLCDTPEEEREHLQQAFRCAHQLKMLIEDVLDVSRIEAGRMTLTREAVSVKMAIDRAIAEMLPLAQAKGLRFRCEPLEDERLTVRADAQRLHQVLRHLIDNAIKFSSAGTIRLVCLAPEAAGHVRFEIHDDGIGMTPEQIESAFDRFVQGDGSATRRFGGTGLGLSLVRDLVQMMGGVVRLESEGEGKGSIASFTLPIGWAATVRGARGGDATPDDRVLGPATGPLVLVVDDDETLAGWIRSVLHAAGFSTVVVDSAERAWMLVRQLQPAALLLDHALPSSPNARIHSGAELARHIAGNRSTADLPMIMLSGHDPAVLDGQGAVPSNVKLLRKPIHRDDLIMALSQAVESNHARSVRVLLAYEDPTLVASVRRALPERGFTLSLEPIGPSLLELVEARLRHFDLILIEPTRDTGSLRPVLDMIGRLEAAPWVVALANAAAYEDPEIAELVAEWPIQSHLPTAMVANDPTSFARFLKTLCSSRTSLPTDAPADAA